MEKSKKSAGALIGEYGAFLALVLLVVVIRKPIVWNIGV